MNKILERLDSTIQRKIAESPNNSHTAKLFNKGTEKCAEKFGEEAIELIVAAVNKDTENFNNEAADVLFHLLVLIESKETSIGAVLKVLESRLGVSGHIEKKARAK